jgi:Tfp pilus assembly protein PilF
MSSAQLGLLALQRGELDEARRRYTDALETSRELGEPRGEAKAWHQLGAVAQEKAEHGLAKEWDEAERCYREALRIFEQLCDLPMLAATCNQLGIVAEGTGRPDDAERWYLRALELKDQVAWHDATTLDNLADLYLSQGRLDEAATCASRALEIKEEPDLSADPWKTYHILGRIAEARGHADEAARWRRKGHESFAASAGAAHEVRQYQPLIEAILAACQGNEEAQQQAEAALEHMASLDQVNRRFAQAARRILAGERDAEVLTQDLEYIGAAIVRTILTRLSGPVLSAVEGTTPTPDRPTGGEVAISLADLFTIVARACRPDAPPGLGEQFHALTHQLSRSPDQPAEIRALGRVLNRVLSGDRDPDLSDLPPALAEAVGRLLETI